ncbi:MAG: hypothetical protein WBJ87_08395 [Candidatus Hydrothermia bacterium]
MSTTEIFEALNSNGMLAAELYKEVSSDDDASDLIDYLNEMTGTTSFRAGMRGYRVLQVLNNFFGSYVPELEVPTGVSLTWEQDYCKIEFEDNTEGEAQHEIWEQQIWELWGEGNVTENYVLRQTLSAGEASVNLKTWQNSTLNYRVRAVKDGKYSYFSEVSSINSPQFVFRIDQTTLRRVTIYKLLSVAESGSGYGTNIVYWGDGTSNNYTNPASNAVYHDYETEGIYWLTITGDRIYELQFYDNSDILHHTDITYWQPNGGAYGFFSHLWNNGFIGDISNWHPDYRLRGLQLEYNNLSPSCVDWIFNGNYTNFFDCHLSSHYINAENCGDLQSRVPKLAHVRLRVKGDISNFIFPRNNDYQSWIFHLWLDDAYGDISNLLKGNYEYLHSLVLTADSLVDVTGDLSSCFFGVNYTSSGSVSIHNLKITKMPRGNFYKLSSYTVQNCLCDSSEIDSVLQDIYDNVNSNAPLYDCVYYLNCTGMGIPSSVGLALIPQIIAIYTAAGKTCSIYVNS